MPEPKWWIAADLHLDHPAILQYNPDTRPFASIEEMNEVIVHNWNSVVDKHDFVIIVGDLAFRNYEKWAQKLKGKKFLILGNHDAINNDARRHFLKVCECLEKIIYRQRCFFFHYPCLTWPHKHEGCYMFHGHCHGRLAEEETTRRCDVSMDAWGLNVIPIEVLFRKMRMKRPDIPFSNEERARTFDQVIKTRAENLALLKEFQKKSNG